MTSAATITDVLPPLWLDDGVVQLREWARERVHRLDPVRSEIVVGTAPGCHIRLDDASGRISSEHAVLERKREHWYVINRSKNGVFLDDVRRDKCLLIPGVELRVGGMTLVAESPRLIALRGVLARLIGWDGKHVEAIDLALRAVRAGATRRAITVLCGEGDLTPIAKELHRLTLPGRPFVLCHPRPNRESAQPAIERAPSGLDAVERASGGTVCILNEKPPPDLRKMLAALVKPLSNVRLIVCAESARASKLYQAQPIELPPLHRRASELGRVIEAYLVVARDYFHMVRFEPRPPDRAWIARRNSDTLAEIERATHRLAAIYRGGSLTEGAALLRITREALRKWLDARSFDLGPWL